MLAIKCGEECRSDCSRLQVQIRTLVQSSTKHVQKSLRSCLRVPASCRSEIRSERRCDHRISAGVHGSHCRQVKFVLFQIHQTSGNCSHMQSCNGILRCAFLLMYAGTVTQATDRSETLYKLHVKPSAVSQLPVGRVRNASHETSASLLANMTALSINTRKQVVSFGMQRNDMIRPQNLFMDYSC